MSEADFLLAARTDRFRAFYLASAGLLLVGLSAAGYPFAAVAVLILGALHLLYDGLIWKLRRPDVDAGFGLDARM